MSKKKPGKVGSRVVRISGDNYDRFTALKEEYAKRLKKKKITYDRFLEEIFGVVELITRGRECYGYGGRLYADVAEARGDALTDAIRTQSVPTMPQILLVVGEDTFLREGTDET